MIKIWIKPGIDSTTNLWTLVSLALKKQNKLLQEFDGSSDISHQFEETIAGETRLISTQRYEFPIQLNTELEYVLNADDSVESWDFESTTTSEDVVKDLKAELERLDAEPLEVARHQDFTVISFFDNQETYDISVDHAVELLAALKELPDSAGFEDCWHELIKFPEWEETE